MKDLMEMLHGLLNPDAQSADQLLTDADVRLGWALLCESVWIPLFCKYPNVIVGFFVGP